MGNAALLWDLWRTPRGGPEAISARQQARLAEIVQFARAASPFYRELYSHLPSRPLRLEELPPVTRSELMERFDDWSTDRAVRR